MRSIVVAKMFHQSLPGETDTFSDLACTIVIDKVFLNGRIEDFIAESVFHDSILYLFTSYRAGFPSLFQDKMRVWQKLIGLCLKLLRYSRQLHEEVHFKLLDFWLPIATLFCSNVGLVKCISIKYLTLITTTLVRAGVVFSIYHTEGQPLLSLSAKRSIGYSIAESKSGRTPLELPALL